MNLITKQHSLLRAFKGCERLITYQLAERHNAYINRVIPAPVDFVRRYCDGRAHVQELPRLMEFPPIIWPSFFKFVKNWMFANFIIRPYFDQDFKLKDFVDASKHAVEVVSGALSRSDWKTLEGLVTKEALNTLKAVVSTLTVSQREMLSVDKENICFAFPYQVGIMFDDADKRWVEITMCYHLLKGYKQLKDGELEMNMMNPEKSKDVYILNYRFIREYTKGVDDSWWVNIVNHYQPQTIMKNTGGPLNQN